VQPLYSLTTTFPLEGITATPSGFQNFAFVPAPSEALLLQGVPTGSVVTTPLKAAGDAGEPATLGAVASDEALAPTARIPPELPQM